MYEDSTNLHVRSTLLPGRKMSQGPRGQDMASCPKVVSTRQEPGSEKVAKDQPSMLGELDLTPIETKTQPFCVAMTN